ncbi:hypothetical protein Poly30_00250 [Planctomycetes bacterium Poly30]|uniref:Uncharacterized protein n=1 Tax=Saltatorellus ferox TaxID=2528018 RepID=A0A518EKB5_9BACT|nr:hypothetical protein Poly30_00250 [Planctomycetes bacterium Poly30]
MEPSPLRCTGLASRAGRREACDVEAEVRRTVITTSGVDAVVTTAEFLACECMSMGGLELRHGTSGNGACGLEAEFLQRLGSA